jgi:hypothetical protein
MNRFVALAAIAFVAFITPALSQGRFGDEAAQRTAARLEREAIRRAEHPELYPPVPGQPAQTTPRAATPEPAPAPVTEPAPAEAAAQ